MSSGKTPDESDFDTMLEMIKKEIIPATLNYVRDLSEIVTMKQGFNFTVNADVETDLLKRISSVLASLYQKTEKFEKDMAEVSAFKEDAEALAKFYGTVILEDMQEVRRDADELETLVGEEYWPFPTYGELLFGVK